MTDDAAAPEARPTGPLAGLRIVQMAAIGPVPLCAMLLADLGAEILCLDRPGGGPGGRVDLTRRGRCFVPVDLRRAEGQALAAALIDGADAVLEGYRPGVMERLGLGPDACLGRNPRLVYGRMTGWGQDGPLAPTAGHDINYVALSGALHAIGRPGERPVPPLNLVGDFGGGALYLAFGMAAALFERERSGRGQVVDAAMVDGVAGLMTMFQGMLLDGRWSGERGGNVLDGSAPWYDTYETADGGHVALGAIEPQFWAALLRGLDIDPASLPDRADRGGWPEIRARLAAVLRTRTRDEWAERFANSDACLSPVLTLREAPSHPHHRARGTYVEHDNRVQPAPAPRFNRTPGTIRPEAVPDAAALPALLRRWGAPEAAIAAAGRSGAIAAA